MGRFLKALEKAGLVEVERQPGETSPEELAPEPTAEAMPDLTENAAMSSPASDNGIAEGQPFQAFYSSIPASPFPAEKMLKLIDGLQAMDSATRQNAILAMDAADDSWSIDDTLADAKAKIAALTDQSSALTSQVGALEKQTAAELRSLETDNDQSVAAVRKQIAELEALLARQIEKSAADKAAANGRLQAAREACTRETGRIHAEASRLNSIVELFGRSKT
jgi:hypothetical protein